MKKLTNKKKLYNISQFCDRKTHTRLYLKYRKYRRGKNRCIICGAKTGKIRCVYKSNTDLLLDNMFTHALALNYLTRKKEEEN